MRIKNMLRAQSTISLPTVGNSYVDAVIGFLQQYLDFSTGALAMVIAAAGMLAIVALWFLAPREGAVGIAIKIVMAAIFLLNIPFIIETFRL